MFGLFIYVIMILFPILIPVGVTVVHVFGRWRTGKQSAPTVARHNPAVARA